MAPAKKLEGVNTVRARLAHGWLRHSTCKTSIFFPGNPFIIQAKRKVWKSQILRKSQNLARNHFKNQAKRKVWKFQIFAPNYNMISVTFEKFFKKSISLLGFLFSWGKPCNFSIILNPYDSCCTLFLSYNNKAIYMILNKYKFQEK